MINIQVEGLEKIAATFDRMVEQIDTLGKQHMAEELTAWQAQDMHRHYPNTTQNNENTVSTEIWPRSRLSTSRRATYTKPVRRVYAPPRGGPPAHRSRPILRSELFDKLCERMATLMDRVLTWQTKA